MAQHDEVAFENEFHAHVETNGWLYLMNDSGHSSCIQPPR